MHRLVFAGMCVLITQNVAFSQGLPPLRPQTPQVEPEQIQRGSPPAVVRFGEATDAGQQPAKSDFAVESNRSQFSQAAPHQPSTNPMGNNPVFQNQPESRGFGDQQIQRAQIPTPDPQVQRATFQQPARNTVPIANDIARTNASPEAQSIASKIVNQPFPENLLEGKPISLKEAIATNPDKQARLKIIKDYWKLSAAMSDLKFAVEEVRLISSVSAPRGAEASALWQAEVANSHARVAEAKLITFDAQEILSQKLGWSGSEFPIATDTPWTGRYRTNVDEHFAANASRNLRRIDRILPVMLELVQQRATAVQSSQSAFNRIEQTYRTGSLPISELLDTYRRVREQRIAFLAALRDYNLTIADYAMSTVNAYGDENKVVAMLLFDRSQGLSKIGNAAQQANVNGQPNLINNGTIPRVAAQPANGRPTLPAPTTQSQQNFGGTSGSGQPASSFGGTGQFQGGSQNGFNR